MKKAINLFLVLIVFTTLFACSVNGVTNEDYTYSAKSHIHSLDIKIGAADFTIERADTLYVKSNLKYLSISEENGVLKLEEDVDFGVTYTDSFLTLYLPENIVFDSIIIATGAANFTADRLDAKSLELTLGAGNVQLSELFVTSDAVIGGGAARISIDGGSIRNLTLEMGVGELKLTSALLGNSDLTFGIGQSSVTILGNKDDYSIDIEKGIGSITIDECSAEDLVHNARGENHINIQGGIGSVALNFKNF
ncbi:MAG: hypothetical protein E7491_02285 [Ruminococcaceae bacterium]|nr:hypothetical protein [Oscillospiraceae bacterium]